MSKGYWGVLQMRDPAFKSSNTVDKDQLTSFKKTQCSGDYTVACRQPEFEERSDGSTPRQLIYAGEVSGNNAAQKCADACMVKKREDGNIQGFSLPRHHDFKRYDFMFTKAGDHCRVDPTESDVTMYSDGVLNSGQNKHGNYIYRQSFGFPSTDRVRTKRQCMHLDGMTIGAGLQTEVEQNCQRAQRSNWMPRARVR